MKSHDNMYDIPTFTTNMLLHSARTYKKISKGSDHWLASELDLPTKVAASIAESVNEAVVSLAWPHQSLLNLHPELGKSSGGFRTIAKTPKLYRLWVRTKKKQFKSGLLALDKGYDTACKGSSALVAAADRAFFAEIATRNNQKVVGTFFDMAKLFDTVQPSPLFDSFVETMFPMVDALMGFQMHMAPRVIMMNAVPSLPIIVEASILAGCGYSVPWVGSLMHPGSVVIAKKHKMYKTYVDDVSNAAAGYGPDVQNAVVECALAFNTTIVVKRKFTLSDKSAVVANDNKLALSVARELKDYDMVVQTPNSTRDVGVMFTAGVFRDTSLCKVRAGKATIRISRISKVVKVSRAARKLFTSGAYPQGTWGHQCVGMSPMQVRAIRRLASSSTGVATRSQRCLTSCIFICFGMRADPWQRILKELTMLWIKIMPQ